MYIHLGDNVAVPSHSVFGVFDLETSTIARDTRQFLDKSQRNGMVRDVCDDIPKAFVLVSPREKKSKMRRYQQKHHTVYITQLSSSTLRKRTSDSNL